MIETLLEKHRVLKQRKTNSFETGINCLAEHLRKQGYSVFISTIYLRAVKHFCYWLKANHISIKSVNKKTLDEFLYQHLPKCFCPIPKGSPIWFCRSGVKLFLEVLREHQIIILPQKPVSAIDKLLDDFISHMEHLHGVTLSTARLYTDHIRKFLKVKYRDGPINLKKLSASEVREYVVTKARGHKPRTVQILATSLRAFFRFLKMTNLIEYSLADAISFVPYRTLSTIPKYLTDEQLHQLLSSFNLSKPVGLRDRTMALLMARTGLRNSEVANLNLEDINWREGVIYLQKSKSRHASSLPLLRDVGTSLAIYLKKGRPCTEERRIFVRHAIRHPSLTGKPLTADAVRCAIRRAFKCCSLPVPSHGPHVLRHTLATQLLQKGANLKEIADVLRHQSINTTHIYAKVNLTQLTQVALPWPKEVTHEV